MQWFPDYGEAKNRVQMVHSPSQEGGTQAQLTGLKGLCWDCWALPSNSQICLSGLLHKSVRALTDSAPHSLTTETP